MHWGVVLEGVFGSIHLVCVVGWSGVEFGCEGAVIE